MHKMHKITKPPQSISRRMLTVLIATVMAFAMMIPATAFAAPAVSQDMVSYAISTYNEPNGAAPDGFEQHVVLTMTFDGAVAYDGTTKPTSTMRITIAGNDITSSAYNRPIAVSTSGNNLILDIGNVIDGLGNMVFTAQYNGIIVVSGTPGGVTVGGQPANELYIETVIPTGVVTAQSGSGNSITATVTHDANVRGMVHIGIYYESGSNKWTPIATTSGDSNAYTFTIHAHNYYDMPPEAIAEAIANITLPTGYAWDYNTDDAFVTLTGPTGQNLHLVIFDENFIKTTGMTYQSIVGNSGVIQFS